jgi:hypothetical protein
MEDKDEFRWVDPPSGWRYGFPKLWDGNGNMYTWLTANGYPQEEIDRMGDYFFTRSWEPTQEELHNGKG